jgi:predicted hotdog family 3-hydroxylacyl-ACP dehydratase
MKADLQLPMDVAVLIPHRAPLRLVDRLLEAVDQYGVVESVVHPGSVLLDHDGVLDPVAMIELMAQAYAALKGYKDLTSDLPPKRGFLVGIRNFNVTGRVLVEDRLQIRVETIGSMGGFAVAAGEVWQGKNVVAEGTIKVWVSE